MKMRWLDNLLIWLTPPCREVVRWVSQDLDGQLTWHQRARMHAHLLICALCKRYRQQLAALRRVLRSDPPQLTGGKEQKLSPEAKEQIKDLLRKSHDQVQSQRRRE